LEKKRVATEFARSQSIGLSYVGHDAGTLTEILVYVYRPTSTRQKRPLPSWRLPCYPYGMICHSSSLMRQSCHFERDFDRALLQLVDILNTQFQYWDGSWHSSLKRLNCWRKSCAKFDSLLLNVQDTTACSLEKVNFKVLTVVSIDPYLLF